jgi:hypothetical protein
VATHDLFKGRLAALARQAHQFLLRSLFDLDG